MCLVDLQIVVLKQKQSMLLILVRFSVRISFLKHYSNVGNKTGRQKFK